MSNDRPRLQAEPRERTGTKYAKRLRAAGQLPAVVYGHGEDPAHISLVADEFEHCLHDGAHLVELSGEQVKDTCLIKDVQFDYLGTTVIHVDLTRVDMSEEVDVWVPIVLKNEERCPGAKLPGAILEQPIVDVEVTCRADAIPDELVVDVSELQMDESYTIGDLNFPPGVRTEHNPDDVVVMVYESQVSEEELEAEVEDTGDQPAEPEVISERKEEDEEAAGSEEADEDKE